MKERKGIVTLHGNPLTLAGAPLEPGKPLPDFTVLDNDLKPVRPADFRGKRLVLSVVPSLDTPVYDAQTRRFNQEAARLGPDVAILTVSMDLPFAQKRWCGAAGIEAVRTASDHRDASFGAATGLLLQELRLLARAVVVADREGIVRHEQIVPEVSQEPDYAGVLAALAKIG
jgi:thiol peroxidase